jgi:NADH-quinone oxidoreductase subunit K
MIPIPHYLTVSAILFTTGAIGVLMRRNALIMLMSIELMLNAVNLSFVAYARLHQDMAGHVFVFLSITVAGGGGARGLGPRHGRRG